MNNITTILIVDDISTNIDVLANTLKDYKVLVAKNGARAIEIAKELKPELILLDIMMPEMDGFEVCKLLKLDADTADIPIIFITAKDHIQDEVDGLELGAVDFIHKPISPPIVLARIKTQIKLIEIQQNLVNKNKKIKQTLNELKETQSRLIQNEKLAALGEIVAGVAHEINTPLGAIKSTIDSQKISLDYFVENLLNFVTTNNNEQINAFMEIAKNIGVGSSSLTTREEREKRRVLEDDLISNSCSELIPYIDELIGMGIYSYDNILETLKQNKELKSVIGLLSELSDIYKSQLILNIATKKVHSIVKALQNYSRKNQFGAKTSTNLSIGIETVLAIYQYKIKNKVKVLKYYIDDDLVDVYEDELNQVWTNLITNAIQAMDGVGTLEITIKNIPLFVEVSIRDTGKGIPDENKDRIFDPFFTTKPKDEGTGIGLDISKRIIEKHKGSINFDSEVGKGTCFNILIPR